MQRASHETKRTGRHHPEQLCMNSLHVLPSVQPARLAPSGPSGPEPSAAQPRQLRLQEQQIWCSLSRNTGPNEAFRVSTEWSSNVLLAVTPACSAGVVPVHYELSKAAVRQVLRHTFSDKPARQAGCNCTSRRQPSDVSVSIPKWNAFFYQVCFAVAAAASSSLARRSQF